MESMTGVSAAPLGAHVPVTRKARVGAQILHLSIAAAVVVLGAFAVWRYAHARTAAVVRYQTSVVDEGPIAAKVTASGALSAIVTVQVGSQVSGRHRALVRRLQLAGEEGPAHRRHRAVALRGRGRAGARELRVGAGRIRQGDREPARVAERSYARDAALLRAEPRRAADLDTAEAQASAPRADVDGRGRRRRCRRARARTRRCSTSRTRASSRPSTASSSRAPSTSGRRWRRRSRRRRSSRSRRT